jgi:hypothetical protein
MIDKIDSVDLGSEFLHGNFYSIKLYLINNTDSTISYWTNSCSWQSNWVFENKNFSFVVECPKNIPKLMQLKGKESATYDGLILSSNLDLQGIVVERLGFVLVKENDVGTDADFISVLVKKIKDNKDIFWTNSFEIRQ